MFNSFMEYIDTKLSFLPSRPLGLALVFALIALLIASVGFPAPSPE